MLKLCAGQLMAVLLAALLLDVGDTPPLTVDEARIEGETILKPTISHSFPVELGTRRLVRTFRNHIGNVTMKII